MRYSSYSSPRRAKRDTIIEELFFFAVERPASNPLKGARLYSPRLLHPMTQNFLLVGAADNTEQLLKLASTSFLFIDDGEVGEAFLEHFPKAKLFDVTKHSFNPLRGLDYKGARDFASTLYSASPEGKDTLTVRNGKRALTKALLGAERLNRVESDNEEVEATLSDMLLSPVLESVLCKPPNFSFKGQVVALLDRSVIGDFDAFLLALLLIGQAKGQVIVPDGGFYLRPLHVSLIRQQRLIAGVRVLSQLDPTLRQELLLIPNKEGRQCTYDDAETLFKYTGKLPHTTDHSDFLRDATEPATLR